MLHYRMFRRCYLIQISPLLNVNRALDYYRKIINELYTSLNDARKGWKKAQTDLLEMPSENIDLFIEYA